MASGTMKYAILLLLVTCALGQDLLFKRVYYSETVQDYSGLWFPDSLTYLGGFRYPSSDSFYFSAGVISFNNVSGNSLFILGRAHYGEIVCEISIPELVIGDVSAMNFATQIQYFYDPSNGLIDSELPDANGAQLAGMYIIDAASDTMLWTGFEFYDAAADAPYSHGFKPTLDLASNDAVGMFYIGNANEGYLNSGYKGGWILEMPGTYQSAYGKRFACGQGMTTIISRTSAGPSMFAFDTDFSAGDTTESLALVYYTGGNPIANLGSQNNLCNLTTNISGAFWIGNSVVFLGSHGTGPYCYGTGATCGDPIYSGSGAHAYPYRYQYWAYDARDFQDVIDDNINPWEVLPYSYGEFDKFTIYPTQRNFSGVSYDAANSILYVGQSKADTLAASSKSVIHAFEVAQ